MNTSIKYKYKPASQIKDVKLEIGILPETWFTEPSRKAKEPFYINVMEMYKEEKIYYITKDGNKVPENSGDILKVKSWVHESWIVPADNMQLELEF